MPRRILISRWDVLPLEKVTEMVARKVIASADASLIQAYYKKGAIVPVHAHRVDRIVHVLQGALRARADGQEVTAREGDVLILPSGVRHQVEALDDTFVLMVSAAEPAEAAQRSAT